MTYFVLLRIKLAVCSRNHWFCYEPCMLYVAVIRWLHLHLYRHRLKVALRSFNWIILEKKYVSVVLIGCI